MQLATWGGLTSGILAARDTCTVTTAIWPTCSCVRLALAVARRLSAATGEARPRVNGNRSRLVRSSMAHLDWICDLVHHPCIVSPPPPEKPHHHGDSDPSHVHEI